jgi:hypothetical protein
VKCTGESNTGVSPLPFDCAQGSVEMTGVGGREADSFAALRNDSQKGKSNGRGKGKGNGRGKGKSNGRGKDKEEVRVWGAHE